MEQTIVWELLSDNARVWVDSTGTTAALDRWFYGRTIPRSKEIHAAAHVSVILFYPKYSQFESYITFVFYLERINTKYDLYELTHGIELRNDHFLLNLNID